MSQHLYQKYRISTKMQQGTEHHTSQEQSECEQKEYWLILIFISANLISHFYTNTYSHVNISSYFYRNILFLSKPSQQQSHDTKNLSEGKELLL